MIIISLFLAALVIFRGILRLPISRWWKVALGVSAAIVAFKFYILRIFGGKMFFAPELPAWILLIFAWLFAFLMFWSSWLILCDLLKTIFFISEKIRKRKIELRFSDARWRTFGVLPAALLVSVGMYYGLKTPDVAEKTLIVKDLPLEFDNLRIVHLSDIHADPVNGKKRVRKIVDISNSLNGDLIVLTGDFVDGRVAVHGKDLEVLKELNAPMGVFGVPGNHEYYSGYDEWLAFLRHDCGIRMLENQSVLLGQGKIALGGVTDIAARHKNLPEPDVVKAFDGVPPGVFRILLAHQPKLAAAAEAAGVDLQLSGHTHGGMIIGFNLLVAAFNNGLYSGVYELGDMILHISNGTGIWNGFPIRLGYPSEISVLTLKRK